MNLPWKPVLTAILLCVVTTACSSTGDRLALLQAESETWYQDVFQGDPNLVKEFGILDVYLDSERDCAIWVFDSWQHFQDAQYDLFDDANILRTGGKGEGETWTLLGSDTTCVGEALNALGNGS